MNCSDSNIKELLLEAIAKVKNNGMVSLSDLYIGVSFDDLSLSVYDDDEGLLAQKNMDDWAILKEDPESFDDKVANVLKKVLHDKEVSNALESLDVIRPFSVILVNDEFEQKEELFLLDDQNIVLEDEFLKNIDKELDEFLEKLLADV
ncbi:MAG: hypothetical protein RR303_00685 [Bacteroidales bacterium]